MRIQLDREAKSIKLSAPVGFKRFSCLLHVSNSWEKMDLAWLRPLGDGVGRVGLFAGTYIPRILGSLRLLKIHKDRETPGREEIIVDELVVRPLVLASNDHILS